MNRRKKIDPRVIGSFVIGAIILTVAGLLFFGPGGFLAETKKYVIFFESSVKGLTVGSPVRFRGVKIGQIRQINVRLQTQGFKFYIPIVIEIDPSSFNVDGTDQSIVDVIKASVFGDDSILPLVKKGLRAEMRLDSLVTGQLYINMDMFPDTPIILTGGISDYPELPAIKSSLEVLSQTFEEIPLKEMTNRLMRIIEGVDKLISSSTIDDTLENLNEATNQLNIFLQNLDKQLPPVVESLKETLEASQQTLQTADSTMQHIDGKIEGFSEQFEQTARSVDGAAEEAQVVMEQLKGLSAADSDMLKQLSLTLEEINRTARAVRYLSTEIERDPQILLRGRGNGETK